MIPIFVSGSFIFLRTALLSRALPKMDARHSVVTVGATLIIER